MSKHDHLEVLDRVLFSVRERLFLTSALSTLARLSLIVLPLAALAIAIHERWGDGKWSWVIFGGALLLIVIASCAAAFAGLGARVRSALAVDEEAHLKDRISSVYQFLRGGELDEPRSVQVRDAVGHARSIDSPALFCFHWPRYVGLLPIALVAFVLSVFVPPAIGLLSARDHLVRAGESEESSIEGEWVGVFELGGESVYVRVQLEMGHRRMKLNVLRMLPATPGSPRSTDARLESSRLRFAITWDSKTIRFDGRVDGDAISGVAQHDEDRGTFRLVRIVPMDQVDPKVYEDYGGAYEVGPNRTVFIRQHDYLARDPPYAVRWSRLYYVDDSGRMGTLYPLSKTTFISGPTFFIPVPEEVTVTFVYGDRDRGKVTGLIWHEKGRKGRLVPRSKLYSQREVRFQSGKVTLAGRLLLPTTKGPHTAVVLARSGDWAMNRNHVVNIAADVFARNGIAALVYDARGIGASGGDWRGASGMVLAADALAAVQFLRDHKDINPRQVGLWGISSSGRIASLAAAGSSGVAFLLLVSTRTVQQADGQMLSIEARLRVDGFADKEIAEAVAFTKLETQFATTGHGWDKLENALKKAQNKKWYSYTIIAVYDATKKDHWLWQNARGENAGRGVLGNVACPVLAIWGDLDTWTPPQANRTAAEEALRAGGNREYTLRILPKCNHDMWLAASGSTRERHLAKMYAPGYFDTMVDWLRQRATPTP